jgi:hypothetical protein
MLLLPYVAHPEGGQMLRSILSLKVSEAFIDAFPEQLTGKVLGGVKEFLAIEVYRFKAIKTGLMSQSRCQVAFTNTGRAGD